MANPLGDWESNDLVYDRFLKNDLSTQAKFGIKIVSSIRYQVDVQPLFLLDILILLQIITNNSYDISDLV